MILQKKLKILISAYACSPYHGSEPGMGWNFILGLSKYHEIHVITEKLKWKSNIERYFNGNPPKNLNFYFIEKRRNKKFRKIWPPSYYFYYRLWQKEAYNLGKALNLEHNFDIIHQLNMVGYREPGYLWEIDKPFVWGPIGGLENTPWRYLPTLGFQGLVHYLGRNIYNLFQRNFSLRVRRAIRRSNSSIIAATPGNKNLIKQIWDIDSHLICEVGNVADKAELNLNFRLELNEPFRIIWSGQHIPGKNLPLLLNAVKNLSFDFELHILGDGIMQQKWQKIAKKFSIEEKCKWHGWLNRDIAISVMHKGHVLCITSLCDLTSTITLEALSVGLPIICLDHLGFSEVVNEKCGIKIPLESPISCTSKISNALELLEKDEMYRRKLSIGAFKRSQEYDWDSKIKKINKIYFELLKRVHDTK